MALFREFMSKKGTVILAGKNAESNEKLVAQAEPNEIVLHTEKPGSPFVNIKGKPKPGDIKFAALICARYSRDWRDNKSNVVVHKFLGKDIYKTKSMKLGTFGVKNFKKINIKKQDIEKHISVYEKSNDK